MIASTDKETLRQAMVGRWHEVLPIAQYDRGRGHPCPKCGGTDRFNIGSDFDSTGAVWCRHCFGESSSENHGDGFSSLKWFYGWTYPQCLAHVATHVGIQPGSSAEWSPLPAIRPSDLIPEYCKAKRIPSVDALQAFGARIGARPIVGRDPLVCIEVPMFSDIGRECGIQDAHPEPPAEIPENVRKQLPKGMNRPKGQRSMVGLFLPVDGIGTGGRLLIVEGVKDAATLWHHGHRQVIGFPGAIPRQALNQVVRAAAGEVQGAFDVVVVPDLDAAGLENARKIGEYLGGNPAVASIAMARLPGARKQRGGIDVRDAIASAGIGAVNQAIENPIGIPTGQRPTLIDDIREERHQLVCQSFQHLAALGWSTPWIDEAEAESVRVYHQAGALVEVIHRPARDVPGFKTVPPSPGVATFRYCTMATRLNRAVCFVRQKTDRDGNVENHPIDPPAWLVQNLLESPGLAMQYLRELRGVLSAPTLRGDGSILQEPGYDDPSGLLLLPGDYGTIPDNPTKGEAEQAAAMLLDVVSEFPCQDIDRAAWLAYVLTLMVRMAIDGNVPMWAFNANQWGSGKGLMIDLGNRIAFGQPSAVRAYDPDPSETRKGITACLMQGLASVCFDNVRDKVANSTLEAALTAQVWSDRLLGKNSETISRPQNLVFSISGNNLRFGGDMGRRLLMVSLFSTVDRPEERKFRQADVVAYVMENRFKLIAAALTILRYRWVAGTMENGRLLPELTPIGSFEAWSRIVRDAVYIATGIDPWLTNQRVRKSDVDEAALEAIHQAFSRYPNGVLASEIIHTESVYTELILETFGIDRGSKGAAVSLGKRLDRFINRIHKGQFLVKNRNDKGFMEYRLETVENLPDGG